jgi:fumarylacetoacetate (FAA) hydrolase family protein
MAKTSPASGTPLADALRVPTLPADRATATLVGRVWRPAVDGPSPVVIRPEGVFDVSETFPTITHLCEQAAPATAAAAATGERLGDFEEILANTEPSSRDRRRPWLLSPVDLQALKAAGVTFAVSMIERVIEERARGSAIAASALREEIGAALGADLAEVRPGSALAQRLKVALTDRGLWSAYLEVGIGPDAEIFTKAPVLASVGAGVPVGVPRTSQWNNPEPEVAIVVRSDGTPIGATLANDVNLRDVEGRSALLLPQAKDNNASCALGPALRLFDHSFDLDAVRAMRVRLEVTGPDDFRLADESDMRAISRDPVDLVDQLTRSHQYPDGVVLMLGTMFAPIVDRSTPGMGFTHQAGDVVRISSTELGSLVNAVAYCDECEPWTFGIRDLVENLARRGLVPLSDDPSTNTRL